MQLALALAETTSSAMLAMVAAQASCPELELPLSICVEAIQAALRELVPYKNGHSHPLAEKKLNGHSVPDESYEYSSWDPDPVHEQIEVGRCRALLLETIRRAAHDWVLYRISNRLPYKQIADEAYIWLFEEGPGHPNWRERAKEERFITAFLSICEALDLDPETVRARVKKMTVKMIMGAGRPAERRHLKEAQDEVVYEEHSLVDINVASLDNSDHYESRYEAHYATTTLGYT